MKHLLLFGCFFLALNASAQKANFDAKTAKEKTENLVSYKFTVTELQSAAQAQALAGKMKTLKPVVKAEVLNATATTAEMKITVSREDHLHVLQNALIAANIQDFTIDGKAYRTANLYDVIKDMKKSMKKK